MTAEEYVKHYASGQGGFESVSVDVALRAIEYAKQEAKQQLLAKAVEGTFSTGELADGTPIDAIFNFDKEVRSKYKEGEKVKIIIIKEE